MLNQRRPLLANVQMDRRTLILSGDLDGEDDNIDTLGQAFQTMAADARAPWIIDAGGMRMVPEGLLWWKLLTAEFLGNCQLTYKASQLSLVLNYEDEYTHPASTFEDNYTVSAPALQAS